MNIKTLKAISYITSVAVEELPILEWLTMLNIVYKDGIPTEARFGEAINYFIEQFPNFAERAQDDSQDNYDKLYADFLEFIKNKKENI